MSVIGIFSNYWPFSDYAISPDIPPSQTRSHSVFFASHLCYLSNQPLDYFFSVCRSRCDVKQLSCALLCLASSLSCDLERVDHPQQLDHTQKQLANCQRHEKSFFFLSFFLSRTPNPLMKGANEETRFISDCLKRTEIMSVKLEALHPSGPNCSRNRACFCKKIHRRDAATSLLPSPPSPFPSETLVVCGVSEVERNVCYVIRESV